MTAGSTQVVVAIAKEIAEEIEKLIAEAQDEQNEQVKRQHSLNIARAKTLTLRKHLEDIESVDESEKKLFEKDMMELEVLRKIQYGEKK